MTTLASGVFLDWEQLTGQPKLVVDLISFPIFSAIAGWLTNWTGVLMLFWPVYFKGFRVPGLEYLYPYFPRRVQVLPTFSGDGKRLGFQGFIPARSEKMASICVDKALMRIGSPRDFIHELDLEGIADYIAEVGRKQVPAMVDEIMNQENPDLWGAVPKAARNVLYQRIERQLPTLARNAFEQLGDNVDQLIDIKDFVIRYLRENPEILKDLTTTIAAPELRFMVRIGLLGAPFGLLLALYMQVHHRIPVVGWLPGWFVILSAAAAIGVLVNVIAVKVVFEPGDPQPRYKYLWKQALLAKRQPEAAADLANILAYQVLTLPNLARELLDGPNGDKTRQLLERLISQEIHRQLGPTHSVVRTVFGRRQFDNLKVGATSAAVGLAPSLADDPEFAAAQAKKIDEFAARKLQQLTPGEFMEMFYASIEQDAWLLYLHGAALGLVVGAVHLILFGW
ncbi:hypothetical protein [Nocardia seriolae]|uniref:DUF445 domain-containing protein n=1 Tax=Nocardia seriolae TaxID=37332 RepID=A0ABC8AKB5_9NOCA|nr:hypothetical protein [Nocardia seriolae]APA94650.1 hypothetical protein NS506_00568 [Nocardia seriolae]OJF83299.1 hypothetical protein NS14008_34530 [Nocardia seriolae]PSK29726.1 hypothetical protein C6575_19635 [Nocardia seriolae]QOW32053.1 hypothetical protein IMZ23_29200 [Nocardia seriolae]QUN19664.1 hypothetical protein KEC46_10275 [Nocardia seriolae]